MIELCRATTIPGDEKIHFYWVERLDISNSKYISSFQAIIGTSDGSEVKKIRP